jgi:hypothetical protein
MLYFSDTVCVLTSNPSSLPVRDGDLESSKGEAKGPSRLLRLPAESELQLDRLEELAETGDVNGDSSSLCLPLFDFVGGIRSSADSPTARGCLYSECFDCDGLIPCFGLLCFVRDREEGCRAIADVSFMELRMLSTPELRRM